MKRTLLVLMLLLTVSAFIMAEDAPSPFVIKPGVRLWGADLAFGYKGITLAPGLDTTLWAAVGGGSEGQNFYRAADGTRLTDSAVSPAYTRNSGDWRLGIEQGILWNEDLGRNLLAGFAYLQGRFDSYTSAAGSALGLSSAYDKTGIFQNSILAGVSFDALDETSTHKTKSGAYAEASGEYAPAFLLNGETNVLRLNLTAKGFIPLFDLDNGSPMNTFSVYAGDFLAVDYAIPLSGSLPINISQTFGGTSPRTGLGSAVRGVDSASYDGAFKVVNNFEIRVNLPAIVFDNLLPGLLLYYDVGYCLDADLLGTANPGALLMSTGGGVFVNILDLATIVVYCHYRIDDTNLSGGSLTLPGIGMAFQF